MRRTRLTTVLLLTPLALAGCGDWGTLPGALGLGTLTARIDGSRLTATAAWASPCTSCMVLADREGIQIIGIDARGVSIGLVLFGSGGEGTYDLTNNAQGGAVLDTADGESYATDEAGASGTAQVTRRTADEIEGLFSFTALSGPGGRSIRVTDGRFNVRIQ